MLKQPKKPWKYTLSLGGPLGQRPECGSVLDVGLSSFIVEWSPGRNICVPAVLNSGGRGQGGAANHWWDGFDLEVEYTRMKRW
jgi:hypothetical protein